MLVWCLDWVFCRPRRRWRGWFMWLCMTGRLSLMVVLILSVSLPFYYPTTSKTCPGPILCPFTATGPHQLLPCVVATSSHMAYGALFSDQYNRHGLVPRRSLHRCHSRLLAYPETPRPRKWAQDLDCTNTRQQSFKAISWGWAGWQR